MSDQPAQPSADVTVDVSPVDEDSRLEKLRAQFEREKELGEPTGAIDAELIYDLLQAGRALRQRVADLETSTAAGAEQLQELTQRLAALEQQANRALVVDQLPANAPLGTLIRLRGDLTGALYLGNGNTRALTKLLPAVL